MNRFNVAVFFVLVLGLLMLHGCGDKIRYQPGKQLSSRPVIDLSDEAAVDRTLNRHYENWRGAPYRKGGESKNGVDCSGFVYQTYSAQFGIILPRTTKRQSKSGRKITDLKLRSGDLVFFKTGWFERHVGIYLHGRHFIHVSYRRGVMLSSLDDYYWRDRFWQARRVLN